MKKYLLFSGAHYYPSGGWEDFQGSFDTVMEAVTAVADNPDTPHDWWHVIDSTTGETVA